MSDDKFTPPTAEQVREVLDYNPDTGEMRWRHSRRGVSTKKLAGTPQPDGRRDIRVLGYRTKTARVAWLLVTGEWPAGEIDHRNTDPGDDRFSNLRDVSRAVNAGNRRRAQKNSTTGQQGVGRHYGKFQARISHSGKNLYLGSFDTAEEAHAAYVEAKRKYHAGCTI